MLFDLAQSARDHAGDGVHRRLARIRLSGWFISTLTA
jgi:hypothetical protein